MKDSKTETMLRGLKPSATQIAANLANDYIVPPAAIRDSHDPVTDEGNYFVEREGLMFCIQKIAGLALSVCNNEVEMSVQTGNDPTFVRGICGLIETTDSEQNTVTVRRDGLGVSTGPAHMSYSGAQTTAEKRLLQTFGNAGGLFLARANRPGGKFSPEVYKEEYNAAQRRGDQHKAAHIDGINLKAGDILNFPSKFNLNALEAETAIKPDGFVTRFFSRATIIAMLNQYFGHLAWCYTIDDFKLGVSGAGYHAYATVTLTLWPNSWQPTSFTENTYGEGETPAQAAYAAEVGGFKRAFSRIGPVGAIQFWSSTFDLNSYSQQFKAALEHQRANPNAPRVINENILLPTPPGWIEDIPHNGAVETHRAYTVPTDGFLPDAAASQHTTQNTPQHTAQQRQAQQYQGVWNPKTAPAPRPTPHANAQQDIPTHRDKRAIHRGSPNPYADI